MIKRVDENGNVRLITNIRKPRKWRRFEYIQGVSGCRIDTEQHGHMNFTYEVKFLAINGVAQLVWYVQDGDTYYKLVLSLTYGASSKHRFWMTYWSSSNTNSNIVFTDLDSDIHIAKVSNGYWYWDGVNKGRTGQHSDSFVTTNTISILPDNYNRIYYFKIWDNTDTLLHEYVPAQYNGQYGMWDLVEDRFYPNAGTGAFTVGPEIKNYDEIYEVRKTTSLLPSGVELYDYILSSGTSWIDTGYQPNTMTTDMELKFQYLYSNQVLVGAAVSHWGTSFCFSTGTPSGNNVPTYLLYNGANSIVALNDSTVYTLYYKGTTVNFNGITRTINRVSLTIPHNIYLFGCNDNGNIGFKPTKLRIYEFRLWEAGILIRNMLPCTYLGEPGMWDTVENKFYRNQGTGLFTLGNKITLKEYEYLESSKTQWIDTSFYPNLDSGSELKVQILPSSGAYSKLLYTDYTSTNEGSILWGWDINNSNRFRAAYYKNLKIITSKVGKVNNNDVYLLKIDKNIYSINGITVLTNSTINFLSSSTVKLFARKNLNGSITNQSAMRLYYCKLYNDNQLVRDFIPVSYNGTLGLWDKVEWKFYGNAGSGSFTLGPEKKSGIYPVWTPIEYLATGSSGQYINTEVSVDSSSSVAYDMIFRYEANGVRRLMGPNTNGECYFGANTNNKYDKRYTSVSVGNIDHIYEEFNGITGIITSKINGVTYTGSFSTKSGSLLIFALTSGYNGAGQYFYSGKILKNNLVVRDFIPVRIGSIGYLFDKVTGKMYGNSGTGKFILGPDINL